MRHLAIIGMAKNAGKTVTLNNIVREASQKGLKLALISYGRDGEEVDAITRQEKPRIYIPPYTYFITASNAYRKSDLEADVIAQTSINSLMGEVTIYESRDQGGEVELVGINAASRVREIKTLIPEDTDLILLDGALDRRSSAMPALTEGLILATGAVVGNTEELVIKRTMHEVRRLTLPEVKDSNLREQAHNLFKNDQDGIIESGKIKKLQSRTSFGHTREIKKLDSGNIDSLVFSGALVDRFAKDLLYDLGIADCQIIVRDGTRVFLNKRNMNLLQKNGINVQVLNSIKLLAVTVNPVSPYGAKLDSENLVNQLRGKLKAVPVYDLWSEEYQSIEG